MLHDGWKLLEVRVEKQSGTFFTIGTVDNRIFVSLRVWGRACDPGGTNSELDDFKDVMPAAKRGKHELDVEKFDVMVGTLLVSEQRDVIE